MTNRADAQSFDRIALQGDNLGKWLPEVLPAGGRRALDLGCGTGKHTTVLAERFAHADAADLSGPMIDLAQAKRARDNITYRQADLLEVGDMGHYDLVLSVAKPAGEAHRRGRLPCFQPELQLAHGGGSKPHSLTPLAVRMLLTPRHGACPSSACGAVSELDGASGGASSQ
ncbi:class I SAM-dependent methyltransferase [Nonomuraea angiospora]|uniref:class I SAM-dependent methyltransferase n=1 Tax=Nonomuraea angiospora TaxID=46172 RepID=UPI00343FACB9